MSAELVYHGHACFRIVTNGTHLLIDPFLSGNDLADISADQVQADYILVSHGHGDHIGDTVAIDQRTGAITISNYEIYAWLVAQGVERAYPLHIGGG